jgi:hypothetical protein
LSNAFVARMTITLDDVTPTVSRVLEVPLGIRLDRLHAVFQAALAWTDSHLWELTFGHTGFGIPDPSYGFDGPLDAGKVTLAEALEGMRGKTFKYLYDFGDAWEHTIKIQSIAPADRQGSYPRLLEATGMRPPEDSGGPWGYAEKLEALADRTHEYHEEALDALGDDHDPHAQPDIDLIRARLAVLAKKWAPRPRKAK